MPLSKRLSFRLKRLVTAVVVGAIAAGISFAVNGCSMAQKKSGAQKRETGMDASSFKAIPDDLVVRLRVLPREQQRYDTAGDWIWNGNNLEVRVSKEAAEEDPRYTTLIFTHELIEALLCRSAGVTQEQVDAFDMSYQGDDEPGDDPKAPYHRQHLAAEAAERELARKLGVDWHEYMGE